MLASSQDNSGIDDRRRLGEEMARDCSKGTGICSWFSQMSEAATEAARRGRLFELRYEYAFWLKDC
jgi:hypothetical protein